ncbi:MAG: protein kinase, partial [Duncaniella sp.]|nr:protein kinase [Duncaniella sp.]
PERAYTVIKVLGQGGFGITYLVTGKVKVGNISLEGRFALKEHFISSLCSRDNATHAIQFSTPVADEVDRSMRAFVKEAQRLQSLGIDHPNIVKINEVFEANNTAYYVMEYLGGTTLRDYVEANGAMSPVAAKALLRPVVEAVAMLHRNNIAHYDIKPGNIMLHEEESGEVRPVLIDFGLSKHYNDRGHATSTLAAAGYTPGYAPVEQYAGVKEFTPQCDVYSLTATLYFCLTGHDPKPALELSAAEVERELSAILPPEEIAPILHALSTMPATRTPDASALLNEVFDTVPAPVGLDSDDEVEIVEVVEKDSDSQHHETTRLPEPEKYNKESKFPIKTTVVICAILAVILLSVFAERCNNSTDIDTEYVTDTIPPTEVSVDTEQSDTVDFQQVVSSDETAKKSERTISGKVVDENGEALIGVSVKAGLTTAITDYNGEFKMYIPEDVKQVTVSCVGCETKTVPVRDNMTIRLQPEKKETSFSPRTSYQNLDLHATRDGKNYYFSQSEWKSLPADEKSKYNRIGVVVIGDGLKFVVALRDSGEEMTWDEAMKRYGNSLPSRAQVEVMAKQYETINKAIIAFGGDKNPMDWYWTKTEYKSSLACAWVVYMPSGAINYVNKTCTNRVRALVPIQL